MKIYPTMKKTSPTVYIRVVDGRGTDFKVSTKMTMDPIYFDREAPGYKKTPDVPVQVRKEFNAKLQALIDLLTEHYQPGIDLAWCNRLIDEFLNPDAANKQEIKLDAGASFFDYCEQYINERKSGQENNRAIRAIFRRLKRYEAWQRDMEGRKDFVLRIDQFDEKEFLRFLAYSKDEAKYFARHPDFFADFDVYHSTIRNVSENAACSTGTRLKAFLNWAAKKGYTQEMSFQNVDTKKHIYGDPYYLTIEERDQVYNYNLAPFPRMARARDMFIFQCLVGCRLGDLMTLTRDNIVGNFLQYIPGKNLANKNTEVVRVPLVEKAQSILARYEEYSPRLFPVMTRQDYNCFIQCILEITGVHRKVTILNPLTRQQEMRPLYEVATSHTARKTFIGNLYKLVKDQELVASLTGHAPCSRAFARYRTIDDDMKRELVEKLV